MNSDSCAATALDWCIQSLAVCPVGCLILSTSRPSGHSDLSGFFFFPRLFSFLIFLSDMSLAALACFPPLIVRHPSLRFSPSPVFFAFFRRHFAGQGARECSEKRCMHGFCGSCVCCPQRCLACRAYHAFRYGSGLYCDLAWPPAPAPA